jgi:hypothetical protein
MQPRAVAEEYGVITYAAMPLLFEAVVRPGLDVLSIQSRRTALEM